MDWLSFLELSAKIAGSIVGIGGCLGALYRWVYLPSQNLISRRRQREREFTAKIDAIYTEIRPNHGSSLKDQVTKVVDSVTKIEKRQRAAHSLERDPLFESDERGRMVWANKSFLRLLGTSLDDVSGYSWKGFVHEDDRDRVYEESNMCLAEQRDFKSIFRYVNSSGVAICCAVEAIAIVNTGVLSGHYGSVHVLPEEKCQ